MKSTRVLIVDDEPAARATLNDMVLALPGFDVVAHAADGRAAIDTIRREKPDLVFLDIDMPAVDGLAVARATEDVIYQLVFVTAHHQHALAAFDTHAIDYLLKPVRPSAMEKCLGKILRQRELHLEQRPIHTQEKSLLLNESGTSRVIACHHILYIEGLGRYRRVHLSQEGAAVHTIATVISDVKLDEFTQQLDTARFLRVHRSYLVNMDRVVSVHSRHRRHALVVEEVDESIPVARARVKDVKGYLGMV